MDDVIILLVTFIILDFEDDAESIIFAYKISQVMNEHTLPGGGQPCCC